MEKPKLTFEEYKKDCTENWDSDPYIRRGQFCMNYLWKVNPECYKKFMKCENPLREKLDPFFVDSRIPEFFDYLEQTWG